MRSLLARIVVLAGFGPMAATRSPCPFHAGEPAMQERLGVRQRRDGCARKVIRPVMSVQHRGLFARLPLLHVGHVDDLGRPGASMLAGASGFVATTSANASRTQG